MRAGICGLENAFKPACVGLAANRKALCAVCSWRARAQCNGHATSRTASGPYTVSGTAQGGPLECPFIGGHLSVAGAAAPVLLGSHFV